MAMTIKELADSLGVSKTAVRKRFSGDFRANYVTIGKNDTLYISDEGCKLIAETLQTTGNWFPETVETTANQFPETGCKPPQTNCKLPQTVSGNGGNTENLIVETLQTTIAVLQEQLSAKDRQLDIKDKQISEQAEQLKNMTIALNKSQQALQDTTAALTAALNTEQVLHAGTIGTMQKQLDTAAESVPEEEMISAETAEYKKGFLSRLFNRRK